MLPGALSSQAQRTYDLGVALCCECTTLSGRGFPVLSLNTSWRIVTRLEVSIKPEERHKSLKRLEPPLTHNTISHIIIGKGLRTPLEAPATVSHPAIP